MKKILFLAIVIFISGYAYSQSRLSRTISIEFKHISVSQALKLIENKTNTSFVYNAEMFSDTHYITAVFTDKSAGFILDSILGKQYAFREKGQYVIIKSTREIIAGNEVFIYTICGYIRDATTGQTIPFASVYDSVSLKSTLSDANGFFELELEQNSGDSRNIGISKNQYRDTFISIRPIENRSLSVGLKQQGELSVKKDSDSGKYYLDKNEFVKALTTLKQQIQSLNIGKNLNRNFQISFLPYLGNHGSMSGKVINNFSLNILGGYNGGFRYAEFGGLFNIDRDSCTGAQFAGLYNLTAGPFRGAQFGGIANNHFSSFRGAQFAGILNTNNDDFNGLQAAGILNFNRKKITGLQAAGILNFSSRVKGTQVAGIMNSAGKVKGSQIAGLFNAAINISGVQIGLINVADSVQGIQIGFLSFSRNGIHQLEASTNEATLYNLTLRTGTPGFYNILGASVNPGPSKGAYGFTYGIGNRLKLNQKNFIHFNLSSTAFYLGNFHEIPSLYKLSVIYEFRLFRQIGIMIGPSANLYYSNGTALPGTGYANPAGRFGTVNTFHFNNGRTGKTWYGFNLGVSLN